jgi:hypothetical protein
MLKTKSEIKIWLDKNGITAYTIQDDLTVDVDTHVFLSHKFLTEIPVQFGVVNGSFFCAKNQLKSLKGAPHTIKGAFHCEDNELINLDYCPEFVTEDFNCCRNPIKNIKKFRSQIDGCFAHSYILDKKCEIKELKSLYKKVENHFETAIVIPGKNLLKFLSYNQLKMEIISEELTPNQRKKLKV